MIVAHADDECIFAGDLVLSNLKSNINWDIVCCVVPDSQSKFRIKMFLSDLPEYIPGTNTFMLNNKDTGFKGSIINKGRLYEDIKTKLKEREWLKIYTHGEKGEYGHIHHIEVHELVVKACHELKLINKLYVFNPKKQENAFISKEKDLLFTNTYDKEDELPKNHPRKWVRGWNTKQGWIEGFKKWT